MELATRTSARNKVKPSIFTPSKYENFGLNKRKAMDKKLEQCNRQADILLMYKHENYILELSLAAYELLKLAMTEYFANHNIYKIQAKDQKDKHGLCTRTSYSVINLNSNKQQYRINLFHTTSRIEVNGRGRQEFLSHLQDIAASMDRKGNCPQLNKLLEQQIKQCIESMQTSGEASLVTHTQDNDLKASGDASLVRTSQLRQKPASGDASLAGSQQSSKDALLDKASRDALLAIKTYERGILHQSSSGDASLEKILQSSQNPASRDALLPGQQQSSGDASLDKSIELNMTNTDNSWDNLLMILCSICAKSVNGLVTPTYFCCRCEQTMHAHCEKDRVANVEDMNNDYICFTCTQMDQTMSNSQKKTTGLKQQSTTQQQK
ncbi:unnamed protein product [Mytilus coruscus]|uniref:Zinc finger PHD-type domain-containing protein n=1 Tax=Mytilus coruscus TaxID=42192 RepID=A0A6J8A6E1_MYTCO|nr:unnamed protein product [Mytilus coruscus]